MKTILGIILLISAISCENRNHIDEGDSENKEVLPLRIDTLDTGIKVIHTPSMVYATLNTKDPDKRGKYQMQHTTSVEALYEDLEIIEFGAYAWLNNQWELKTIYDRPFNQDEFIKWYNCNDGLIIKGEKYSDTDNWIGKGNVLNGREFDGLWYFIGKNKDGKLFVGKKEVTGIMKMK